MSKIDEQSNFQIGFYAIKDVQLDIFSVPFVATSDREACSIVRNSIEKGSALYQHSSLFAVYRVGTFDDKLGAFSSNIATDRYFVSTIDNLLSSDMYSHEPDHESEF